MTTKKKKKTTTKTTKGTMYRQGDVLIVRVDGEQEVGDRVKREAGRIVLAHGEATGHSHAIADKAASLFLFPDGKIPDRILRARTKVTIRHEEHAPIELPAGDYIVRIQREYVPGELPRQVVD